MFGFWDWLARRTPVRVAGRPRGPRPALRPEVERLEDRAVPAALQMEALDRGTIAVNRGASVYVGWRLLGTDPADVAFNLYRSADGAAPVRLNAAPLTTTTDFVDSGANLLQSNTYFVRPVLGGVEGAAGNPFTLAANAPVRQYLNVPLQIPAGGVTPAGQSYTYSANDASVGDLDGDGQYEIILKWDPSNAKDNAHDGYTGNVYLDAYKLDGTLLWRIDLGRNIRAGAHYTQFIVYDLDGDGRAEVACKTADGTVDGTGLVIGNPAADWRNSQGRVLSGPEYLTVFDGLTGAALATTNYLPARGSVSSWGDNYGNRVDRFLATVAYLDGARPSLVMARGYYTRSVLVAWDWRGGRLTQRWTFDTNTPGNGAYAGQGNHNLSVADVDGDGRDEIVYGGMVVDDNGTGLYTTGLGHGDAMHVADMDPSRPGLEVFKVNESPSRYGAYGGALWDAATGELLAGIDGHGGDVGRGVAFDIDPRYPGFEMWTSSDGGIYNVDGTRIQDKPANIFTNFGIWWDADPLRELLDGTTISDWRITNGVGARVNYVSSPAGLTGNNGTKNTPALVADLFGDWREEVIWRRSDNSALQIWTTTIPASSRIYTLMHDALYRVAVATQNVAYNQPAHTSFYLGHGMTTPPPPNIYTVPLPTGWGHQDVGAVAAAGSARYAAGVFTVKGSGDFIGAADRFSFASRGLSGDGSIAARVTSQTNTHGFAKAGVMFRGSAAPNSAFAAVVTTPGAGGRVMFFWRSTDGGPVRYATAYHPVPVWVRMTRVGNSFTASYSADGANWTQVGSPRTVTMPADALVGLAVGSATSGLSTATFSDVTVTGEDAWFTP